MALARLGLKRLKYHWQMLVERFALKMSLNARFASWLPVNETSSYSLHNTQTYCELPFCTERLHTAPLYFYHRVLNFLETEKD